MPGGDCYSAGGHPKIYTPLKYKTPKIIWWQRDFLSKQTLLFSKRVQTSIIHSRVQRSVFWNLPQLHILHSIILPCRWESALDTSTSSILSRGSVVSLVPRSEMTALTGMLMLTWRITPLIRDPPFTSHIAYIQLKDGQGIL